MAESAVQESGIEIRNLSKLFGPRAQDLVHHVKLGMGKVELNEKYGHILGLHDINMSLAAGKIHVIMGLSGSGKSTLIRHVNRLVEPTMGEILIGGVDVLKLTRQQLLQFRRENIAMVFQKFGLLPHRTVIENTTYGLAIQGVPRAERVERARRWIDRVGLSGFEEKYPNQLSGGMQQRVGLARALANDAPILLMDEAFSALDPLIRSDMQSVLLDLQRDLKKTILFITHDLDEALRIGDTIVILREGGIVQGGTAEQIILEPADDYVRRFVREVDRSKFLTLTSILDKGAAVSKNSNAMALPCNIKLGEAVRRLSAARMHECNVQDDDGKLLGSIGLASILDAMTRADDSADRRP